MQTNAATAQAAACAKGVFALTESAGSIARFYVLNFIVQEPTGLTAHLAWFALAHVRGGGPRIQLFAMADLHTQHGPPFTGPGFQSVHLTNPENGPINTHSEQSNVESSNKNSQQNNHNISSTKRNKNRF